MQTEAMVIEAHGGPEVIVPRTIEIPPPGPREVRVRVHAVAMNHMDLWVRRGGPAFRLTYPHRLGCDIAGVVDELGPGARGVAVGDRVMVSPGLSCGACKACLSGHDNLCKSYRILGENAQGGYTRHLNLPDQNLLKIGDDLSFSDAAALPLCTLTAWQMVFKKGKVAPGQTVLIHAAGSGVSSLAIKLCKMVGARVLATTSDPGKRERALAIGADQVIVTREQDFVAETKRLTGKLGADVVLDHVGGEIFEKSIAAVAWGGKIVTCGATAGFATKVDLRQIFFRQVEILGSTMGSKGDLCEALPMILDGRIRATVDRIMPLSEARAAHEALEGRTIFGKLVLSVD
ncbi:MAG: zinc-binding dehydrogenase [Byssovorax sp.]